MPLVPAICTQCGANIEVDNTHEAGVCKYCGTAFITEKVINNYTTNITNNNTFVGATVNIADKRAESMIAMLKKNLKKGEWVDFSINFDKAKELDYYNPELWQMGIEMLLQKREVYRWVIDVRELDDMFDNLKERASKEMVAEVSIRIASHIEKQVIDKVVKRAEERKEYNDYLNECVMKVQDGNCSDADRAYYIRKIDEKTEWQASEVHKCFDWLNTTFALLVVLTKNDVLKEKAYESYESAFRKFWYCAVNELNFMIKPLERTETAKLKEQYLLLYDALVCYITSEELKSKCSRKKIEDIVTEVKPVVEENTSSTSTSEGGCYVATCVYGSYDCPEVWTLRRFRDYTLDETWYGRLFIKCYYLISPRLVKMFGNKSWFKAFWKKRLDKMVSKLKENGVKDTRYFDKY